MVRGAGRAPVMRSSTGNMGFPGYPQNAVRRHEGCAASLPWSACAAPNENSNRLRPKPASRHSQEARSAARPPMPLHRPIRARPPSPLRRLGSWTVLPLRETVGRAAGTRPRPCPPAAAADRVARRERPPTPSTGRGPRMRSSIPDPQRGSPPGKRGGLRAALSSRLPAKGVDRWPDGPLRSVGAHRRRTTPGAMRSTGFGQSPPTPISLERPKVKGAFAFTTTGSTGRAAGSKAMRHGLPCRRDGRASTVPLSTAGEHPRGARSTRGRLRWGSVVRERTRRRRVLRGRFRRCRPGWRHCVRRC